MLSTFVRRNYLIKIMQSTIKYSGGKITTTFPDQPPAHIEKPFEYVLGCLGNCKILSIQHDCKERNIPIEKIEIYTQGIYNKDFILGKETETQKNKNTFESITSKIIINSSEQNKEKLEEIVKKAIAKCPIVNTFKLAGVEMKQEINLL